MPSVNVESDQTSTVDPAIMLDSIYDSPDACQAAITALEQVLEHLRRVLASLQGKT